MKKLFPLIIFCFVLGCKKTPPEEKIKGKWKIDKAFVDGVDKTSDIDTLYFLHYLFSGWVESRNPNLSRVSMGMYFDESKASWNDSCFTMTPYATYEINDDFDEITFQLLFSGSRNTCDCIPGKSFIPMFINCPETWSIIKRKYSELWLNISFNGNKYETHLKRLSE